LSKADTVGLTTEEASAHVSFEGVTPDSSVVSVGTFIVEVVTVLRLLEKRQKEERWESQYQCKASEYDG